MIGILCGVFLLWSGLSAEPLDGFAVLDITTGMIVFMGNVGLGFFYLLELRNRRPKRSSSPISQAFGPGERGCGSVTIVNPIWEEIFRQYRSHEAGGGNWDNFKPDREKIREAARQPPITEYSAWKEPTGDA